MGHLNRTNCTNNITMMKKLNILIADDSMASRLKIKNSLQEFGEFIFTEATNGNEVIELLNKESFEFLILDILMPELNGIKVLETIKEKNINVKTIVLTADTQTSTKRICSELGAINVAHKTINMNQLKDAVRIAINKLNYHEN